MIIKNRSIVSSDLLTQSDVKEHASVEQWRYREKIREEELKRLKCGHSTFHQTTLRQQIQDQIQAKTNEENLSNAYVHDNAKHQEIIHLLNIRQDQDRRNLCQELNNFRVIYQQSKEAREYDLNETAKPAIGHSDEQYGPGSCLVFEGEDRKKPIREKIQKDQMNRWIAEQCRLKQETMQQQQLADQLYDYNQVLIGEYLNALEARQRMFRRQWENDIRAFNKALADEKQCQRNVELGDQ